MGLGAAAFDALAVRFVQRKSGDHGEQNLPRSCSFPGTKRERLLAANWLHCLSGLQLKVSVASRQVPQFQRGKPCEVLAAALHPPCKANRLALRSGKKAGAK
jgi:hypothetical protein